MRRSLPLLAIFVALLASLLGACQSTNYCPAPDACHADGVPDSSGACVNAPLPDGSKCNDSNACTSGDSCHAGVCSGLAVTCAATSCQTAASCDPNIGCGAPQNLPDGSACDDHSLCTDDDHCVAGACEGNVVVACSNAGRGPCTRNACNPNTGQCADEVMTGPCTPNLMPTPTFGCPYNDYVALINVGNSNLALLLDSGSTTLAVANANCTSCSGITPLYRLGPNGQYLGTFVSAQYLDQSSWQGRTYSDHVTPLGTTDTVSMRLAAINQQSGFFRLSGCTLGAETVNSYQGIIGLAGVNLAVRGTDSYMDKAANSLPNNAFSTLMCNPNGLIWWGGYDPVSLTDAPNFTPFTSMSTYYEVAVIGVDLGGVSLGDSNDFNPVVVDTGTSVIMLPTDSLQILVNQLGANATFLNNFGSAQNFFQDANCLTAAAGVSATSLDASLPTLDFTFPDGQGGSFTASLKATQSYLQPMATSRGGVAYCPGVAGGTITILGGAGMVGNVFIFDRDNGQLGIGPTQACTEM